VAVHAGQQLPLAQGLAHKVVAAQGQPLHDVLLGGGGADEDDGYRLVRLADLFAHLKARHAGHHHVEEDDVGDVGLIGQQLQRLLPAHCLLQDVVRLRGVFQEALQYHVVGGVIVHRQDERDAGLQLMALARQSWLAGKQVSPSGVLCAPAEAVRADASLEISRAGNPHVQALVLALVAALVARAAIGRAAFAVGGIVLAPLQGELEGGPFSDGGCAGDGAVKGLQERLDHAEPKPRAAVLSRQRIGGLGKRFKDLTDARLRDAAAGVGHRDLQHAIWDLLCAHLDVTLFGELGGIAQQVSHDLGNAALVAFRGGQIGVDVGVDRHIWVQGHRDELNTHLQHLY